MKARAIYSYKITPGESLLAIRDLWSESCSAPTVTNDAEAVLTEIRSIEGPAVESLFVTYLDTDNRWDTIVPHWVNGVCVGVHFEPGTP